MLIPIETINLPNTLLSNHIAQNVLDDFSSMPEGGCIILVNEDSSFPPNVYSRGIDNHFQGIQRCKDGKSFISTAGAKNTQEGHLFITSINSYLNRMPPSGKRIKRKVDYETGPIGNNSLVRSTPALDAHIGSYEIETGNYWHAGGFSILDHVAVVPVEYKVRVGNVWTYNSKILFLDIEDLSNPKRNAYQIMRQGKLAGATSIIQLSNGLFICAVWTDSDTLGHRFDFYISQSSDVFSNYRLIGSVAGKEIDIVKKDKPKFQSINFVKEQSGKIFLLAFSNTSPLPSKGENRGYLIEVFTDQMFTANTVVRTGHPTLSFIAKKSFGKAHSYCDFSASAGVHITSDGQLIVYGGHHYRRASKLKFSEFVPKIKNYSSPINHVFDCVIELYEHEMFKGRCLKIYGTSNSTIQDYRIINVAGSHFDNGVSSIRFLLPFGNTYTLYPKPNLVSRGSKKLKIDLVGTGNVVEWPILGEKNGVVSSSSF